MFIDPAASSRPTSFPVADIPATETREERRRRKGRERWRRWRANNPEKAHEKQAMYRADNPEKVHEGQRRWRANNPEKDNDRKRRWRESNPEKARESTRRWREKNPEKAREIGRKNQARYRANNPEKIREYERRYQAKQARIAACPIPSGKTLKTALLQNDLYAEASRQVPAGLPGFIRDDIISDIVIAVLDGEISAADIALKAKGIMKAYWRQFGDQRFVSLDATMPGTDLKRIDLLTYEEAYHG